MLVIELIKWPNTLRNGHETVISRQVVVKENLSIYKYK